PLCIYRYPGIIYKPDEKSAHDNAQTGKGYRKAKKIGSKYNSGLGETLEYIGCYNPLVLDFLLKCNIPYKDARKIVKKMINSII
ncbi:MAG TPA: hypothetical protein DD429_00230, partial [Clostridiaceae bacterium]|nr:hypothetical protein [Clostridiaceae bacterium]